ncbi:bacillithiol system redox-active protein YtxJ [Bacillus sp. SL00103]
MGPLSFLKHSLTCPISQAAFQEFEAFASAHEDISQLISCRFKTHRELSSYDRKVGVKHESPQALVFSGGKVKWHASHSSITKEALEHNV